MVHWEHRYLLGTMVFSIAGNVVRDFDEEYEAWRWLESEGWGLVAIEPPDPVRPGACKYYFKRQSPSLVRPTPITTEHPIINEGRRSRRL
ncbi:hypothetical protein [Dictyobacter formicarum]|uniref:DUF4177 domain-containing protein n=1 Tax=Dictyobacter formicarum TaxID=2778368 RepID=A0ABQ3VVB2_9CHLR|nr:hypothetical protein [Dictyobacter formicarum]GHO89498.1 hypothetical protein KSZ_75040 [Dictyobacter formicarum]